MININNEELKYLKNSIMQIGESDPITVYEANKDILTKMMKDVKELTQKFVYRFNDEENNHEAQRLIDSFNEQHADWPCHVEYHGIDNENPHVLRCCVVYELDKMSTDQLIGLLHSTEDDENITLDQVLPIIEELKNRGDKIDEKFEANENNE